MKTSEFVFAMIVIWAIYLSLPEPKHKRERRQAEHDEIIREFKREKARKEGERDGND